MSHSTWLVSLTVIFFVLLSPVAKSETGDSREPANHSLASLPNTTNNCSELVPVEPALAPKDSSSDSSSEPAWPVLPEPDLPAPDIRIEEQMAKNEADKLANEIPSLENVNGLTEDSFFQTLNEHQALVKPLNDPETAFLSKILAIRTARKTIDVTYFSIRDSAGDLLLKELRDAMLRGVRVRLLVDHLGEFDWQKKSLVHLMRTAPPGMLEVKTINPIINVKTVFWAMLKIFTGEKGVRQFLFSFMNRSHEKILIIDRGTPNLKVFMGGRNINNLSAAFGIDHETQRPDFDLDYLIRPASSESATSSKSLETQIFEHYEKLFYFMHSTRLSQRLFGIFKIDTSLSERRFFAAQDLAKNQMNFEQRLKELENADFFNSELIAADLRFVHEIQNLIRPDRPIFLKAVGWHKNANPNSIFRSIRQRILRAKKRIEIVSPYIQFYPNDLRLIEKWLLKNPEAEFHVYTNSKQTTDHHILPALFDAIYGPSLVQIKDNPKIGERLKVFTFAITPELKAKGFLHMKFIRIDGVEVLKSTSNLDALSRIHNSEVGLWIRSSLYFSQMNSVITELRSLCVEWGSEEWTKLNRPDEKSWKFPRLVKALIKFFRFDLLL